MSSKKGNEVNGNNQSDVENGKTTTAAVASSGWRSVRRVLWRAAVMIVVLAALSAVFALSWLYLGWISIVQLVVVAALVYVIASGGWRWLYVAIRTVQRDMKALWAYIRLLWLVRSFSKKNYSLPDIFHQSVLKHPDKPCFLFQDQVWTFAQVEEYSLRVTAVLRSQGYGKGSIVGLLIGNCPQLPAIWLGCARLGIVCPLINTNQRGRALLHSIHVANCDAVIFEDEYETAMQDILPEVKSSIKHYRWSPRPLRQPSEVTNRPAPDSVDHIGADITVSLEATAPAVYGPSEGDGFQGKILYIYTSGTTGLPKAAVISNSRIVFLVAGIHYLASFKTSDIVYAPLPLYHTAGGIMSVGQAFIFGCTVVLRSKFSASAYIPDCKKYNATIAHYIGEMCRYVLATPPSPTDTQHKLRMVFGNGLRPQIWPDFVARFNIPRVAEFYGATEGNANIVNVDGKVGAIGFVSRIIPSVYPIAIIKVDPQTGDPIRNSKGLCQLCKPDEPGVFIGKINASNPSRAFLGYVNEAESNKKIVRDVFSHGDSAFISGDLLVADELGYLFFKDRTGDTFRWRGENVSTSEVEAAVSRVANHRDAVVYGVQIPGVEGRAGMCGLVDVDSSLNLKELIKGLSRDLPSYAQPVFLRILTSVDMTGTFKMKKNDLQEQGFDPNVIKDKLYYFEKASNDYIPLTQDIYAQIVSGKIRF